MCAGEVGTVPAAGSAGACTCGLDRQWGRRGGRGRCDGQRWGSVGGFFLAWPVMAGTCALQGQGRARLGARSPRAHVRARDPVGVAVYRSRFTRVRLYYPLTRGY